MTLDLLNLICKENRIPANVHLTSNSGWECGPTEMDGIFYNRERNELEFTQKAYLVDVIKYSKEGFECLYNEGNSDLEMFTQNCYECKHRESDVHYIDSPCNDAAWHDLWQCPHFEPMRKD